MTIIDEIQAKLLKPILDEIINKPFRLLGIAIAFFVADYINKWSLLIAFIAFCLGISILIERLLEFTKLLISKCLYRKLIDNRLKSLNPQEIEILSRCINENSKTFYLQSYNEWSVVEGMHNKGIVVINGLGNKLIISGVPTENQPITISDVAWELLINKRDKYI